MIAQAIASLKPGAEWVLRGETYEDLEWLDTVQSKPQKAEVLSEVERLLSEYNTKQYQRQRAPEYPPVSDLADALYWASEGDDSKLTAYYAACAAVKAKYPKPEVTP